MLGAQRQKQQILLRYLSNRKFCVILDNKYACNTFIETDGIMFLQNRGTQLECQALYNHLLSFQGTYHGSPQLHGKTGRQRLLLKHSNQRTIV